MSRKYDLPDHKDLIIVPPRMALYIEKNKLILDIFRKYAAEEDILVYSIDEAFIRISPVKKLYQASAYEIAHMIQLDVYHELGLYVTVGIGDNHLLAKLCLDNEAKNAKDFKAEWRYEDVQEKVWSIDPLTDFWGIGSRTADTLKKMGIRTVKQLANLDVTRLKSKFGILGEQLFAHTWGLDRSDIRQKYKPLENKEHPVGGSKANWFEKGLGFNQTNSNQLSNQIKFDQSKATQTSVQPYSSSKFTSLYKPNQTVEAEWKNLKMP